jgi:hypothetical protein
MLGDVFEAGDVDRAFRAVKSMMMLQLEAMTKGQVVTYDHALDGPKPKLPLPRPSEVRMYLIL